MTDSNVKAQLDETVEILDSIVNVQRSDVFPTATIDSEGRHERTEDGFEHMQSLTQVLLEQHIPMIYNLLGIESDY